MMKDDGVIEPFDRNAQHVFLVQITQCETNETDTAGVFKDHGDAVKFIINEGFDVISVISKVGGYIYHIAETYSLDGPAGEIEQTALIEVLELQ